MICIECYLNRLLMRKNISSRLESVHFDKLPTRVLLNLDSIATALCQSGFSIQQVYYIRKMLYSSRLQIGVEVMDYEKHKIDRLRWMLRDKGINALVIVQNTTGVNVFYSDVEWIVYR